MYIVPFATKQFDINSLEASKLVSIMAVTELVFRLPWGILSDRKGINRHYILGGILISLGFSLVMMGLSSSYTMMAIVCAFSGIFQVNII